MSTHPAHPGTAQTILGQLAGCSCVRLNALSYTIESTGILHIYIFS